MATVLLLLTCLLVLGSSLFGCVPDAEAAVNNANQNQSPLNVNSWHDRQRRLVNGGRTGDTTPEEVWYSFMKNGRVLSRGEREAKHVDYDGNRESYYYIYIRSHSRCVGELTCRNLLRRSVREDSVAQRGRRRRHAKKDSTQPADCIH